MREPLLHFLFLGALLFWGYGLVQRRSGAEGADAIVVDAARAESIKTQFQRSWQRPPTPEEQRGLIESWVREEIMYKEALTLKLDRDDPVIKRRLAQKLGQMMDAQATIEVSQADLQGWLDAHVADYEQAPRYAFEQIYFNPNRDRAAGRSLDAVIEAARKALAKNSDAKPGDATMLPQVLELSSRAEVAGVFGQDFAASLAALPEPPELPEPAQGQWQGPISSEYGLHLVRIVRKEPGQRPTLAQAAVRAAVERDLIRSRSEQASEAQYQALRQRYSVRYSVRYAPDTNGQQPPGSVPLPADQKLGAAQAAAERQARQR